jgi:DNA-binding beta-propeller fold protein YncE
MKRWVNLLVLLPLLGAPLVFAAPPRAQVVVLSNSSPHVSVIDAETNQITKTADIPQMTSWAWNDDNNYFDGKNLWLGMWNPDTKDVEVVLLDLDSLRVTKHIPLGQDAVTIYIGKASQHGKVLVSKHASGEVAVIDRKTLSLEKTLKVPVDGGVACDIDLAVAPDGVERAFVPTNNGNSVLSIDTATLQVGRILQFPGTHPFMLTADRGGQHVWVEERTGDSVAIVDGPSLQLVKRVPVGKTPIIGTFTPDGRFHYTGHVADTVVVAHDTRTFKEVWRSTVGTNPEKLGVHPAGTLVYAILTQEGAVAVLDARSGKLVTRISLGTNPTGIFVRRVP